MLPAYKEQARHSQQEGLQTVTYQAPSGHSDSSFPIIASGKEERLKRGVC